MKIVIMAGGKGTRIASVNAEVPKPMIQILGKPILEYQIEVLKKQGYRDIVFVVGHLGNVIQDYFGDGSGISPATQEPFGVQIEYVVENEPLGTAGALFLLRDRLREDFLLLNGDIIFDIDVQRFEHYHKENGRMATLFTHPNSHPYDSGIIIADSCGVVTDWLHKEDERKWYRNRVNAGLHMISPRIFNDPELFQTLKKIDLDREILKPLIPKGELLVYDSPEYVRDMGTPDRYQAVIQDIQMGKVQAKNLCRKQKAIFLDRDGTINQYVGFLNNIDEFKLMPGVPEAIGKMNERGYLVIVVTNQPVIARGEMSLEELGEVHKKMETLLGEKGAYVDAIYYCPHHPDKGFEGERPEYKIDCDCRKPKPGMLLKAAREYHIDLAKSWMVGDSLRDIEAGKAAGCQTASVGKTVADDVPYYEDLLAFTEKI